MPGDAGGVLDLLRRELHADSISPLDFERKVLLDPNFRRDGAHVAKSGDAVVGFMLGLTRKHALEDGAHDFDRGWITLMAVDALFRRQGIGSALLARVIGYIKQGGAKSAWVSPYAPNYFTPGIDEAAYPGAIAFLRASGFDVAYRPLSMEAALQHPTYEAKERTVGVRFDTFNPEYILPLTDFLRREFPGDWQRLMRDTMCAMLDGTPGERGIFVAMEGGACIGFARNDGERFGPFGVSACERGRGIGAELLRLCLNSMVEKGLIRAWFAWTDDRAAKLYARFGFVETRRYSVMKREV